MKPNVKQNYCYNPQIEYFPVIAPVLKYFNTHLAQRFANANDFLNK